MDPTLAIARVLAAAIRPVPTHHVIRTAARLADLDVSDIRETLRSMIGVGMIDASIVTRKTTEAGVPAEQRTEHVVLTSKGRAAL